MQQGTTPNTQVDQSPGCTEYISDFSSPQLAISSIMHTSML